MITYKIKSIKNKIKMVYQREKRGYADQDVWNIDCWFLDIMPKMLKQLKETSHGYPATLTEKEWSDILDRMVFLLNEMDEDKCSYDNPYEDEYFSSLKDRFEKVENGWRVKKDELSKLYFGEEKNKWNYINLCKKEFFDLFSKYFYNLWD